MVPLSNRHVDPAVPSRGASERTITDRLTERLREAGSGVDQSRSRSRRRGSDARRLGALDARTPEELREARSLRRVFLDMGKSYREYRRRTGEPVSPEVRDAAVRFRRERSVTSLAGVAASLDELRILSW